MAGSGAMAVAIGVGFKRDADLGSVVVRAVVVRAVVVRDGGFFVVRGQDSLT